MSNKKATNEEVKELYAMGLTHSEIASALKCHVRRIGERIAKMKASGEISDLEDVQRENVKLAKRLQKQSDLNRIKNKSFRETARLDNAVTELSTELLANLQSHKLSKSTIKRKRTPPSKKNGGILQISDVHFGELVNLMYNKYDFTVASKRLAHFVDQARVYFDAQKVTDVVVCLTGDILNSARRLDEMLSQASNRSKALLLSIIILKQLLVDLGKTYNVTVVSVVGNESRLNDEPGFSEALASDNFDYLTHNILSIIFENTNIRFSNTTGNEQIIEIVGQKILAIHGNQVKGGKTTQAIQKIIGKYALHKENIDFVIFGHLHACKQSEFFARSGSPVGSNAYSDNGLQLYSRASQNIHIFYKNGNRDSIKIDLQNVDHVDGYEIVKSLEKYQCKSVDKLKKKYTINRVVI